MWRLGLPKRYHPATDGDEQLIYRNLKNSHSCSTVRTKLELFVQKRDEANLTLFYGLSSTLKIFLTPVTSQDVHLKKEK